MSRSVDGRGRETHVNAVLLCGRHDEGTPATIERAHERIPGSEFHIVQLSSNPVHAVEPKETFALIRRSIGCIEAR